MTIQRHSHVRSVAKTIMKIISSHVTVAAWSFIHIVSIWMRYPWVIGFAKPVILKEPSKVYAQLARPCDRITLQIGVLGVSDDGREIMFHHQAGHVSGNLFGTGSTLILIFLLTNLPTSPAQTERNGSCHNVVISSSGSGDFKLLRDKGQQTDFGILLPDFWTSALLASVQIHPNLNRQRRSVHGMLWTRRMKFNVIHHHPTRGSESHPRLRLVILTPLPNRSDRSKDRGPDAH